ncbi:MAG: PH domain-containing protein [Pygmaiobacter sp.]|jgi:membrane protein YdbS with pleckstrin-like domain|nr:PH domain-containing protein [Pygmaiobacter sp.]
MTYTVSLRGALLPALWLAGLSVAAGFVVWLLWSVGPAVAVTLAGLLLLVPLPFLRRRRFSVAVAGGALCVTSGYFLQVTHTLPVAGVTGVTRLVTPLGRLLNATALVVFSTGGALTIVGLTRADAMALRAALTDTEAPR